MGKHTDDLQKALNGMEGFDIEATNTMLLGTIAGYLAQILDILEDMTQGGEGK